MKITVPVLSLVFLLFTTFSTLSAKAQPLVIGQRFQMTRIGEVPLHGLSGTFRFMNGNTDLKGLLQGTISDGVFMACRTAGNPCLPGMTLRVRDVFTGLNPFRSGPDQVTINGTTYNPPMYYRGGATIDGGTIRIPYYFAKRQTFKITVRSRLQFGIGIYTNPTFNELMYDLRANLEGLTTLVFVKTNNGYDIQTVTHNYPGV